MVVVCTSGANEFVNEKYAGISRSTNARVASNELTSVSRTGIGKFRGEKIHKLL